MSDKSGSRPSGFFWRMVVDGAAQPQMSFSLDHTHYLHATLKTLLFKDVPSSPTK